MLALDDSRGITAPRPAGTTSRNGAF